MHSRRLVRGKYDPLRFDDDFHFHCVYCYTEPANSGWQYGRRSTTSNNDNGCRTTQGRYGEPVCPTAQNANCSGLFANWNSDTRRPDFAVDGATASEWQGQMAVLYHFQYGFSEYQIAAHGQGQEWNVGIWLRPNLQWRQNLCGWIQGCI